MIFLEGDLPDEPMVAMVLIRPDGTVRHVMFTAERLSTATLQELFWPAVDDLLYEPQTEGART